MHRIILAFSILVLLNSTKVLSQAGFMQMPDTFYKKLSCVILPQNFYTKHMGLVCKMELSLQKTSGLPFYFRLGSLRYVDYLEKKPTPRTITLR
jgi:hypothetical protein